MITTFGGESSVITQAQCVQCTLLKMIGDYIHNKIENAVRKIYNLHDQKTYTVIK